MSSHELQTLRNEVKAQEKKIADLESELAFKAEQTEDLADDVIEALEKEKSLLQVKEHLERKLADMVTMTEILERLKGNGLNIVKLKQVADLEEENMRLLKEQRELLQKLNVKRMELEEVNSKRMEIEEAKSMAALEGSGLGGRDESGSV